jgi:truncated hemoglobin YjbI
MISLVEGKRFGLPPRPFIEESSRMTRFAPFLRLPTWRSYALDRVSMLLGGRVVYTGKDIHAAHSHAREQGLNDGHFDRFLCHFREALTEVGVEPDKADTVTKLLESRRSAILNP